MDGGCKKVLRVARSTERACAPCSIRPWRAEESETCHGPTTFSRFQLRNPEVAKLRTTDMELYQELDMSLDVSGEENMQLDSRISKAGVTDGEKHAEFVTL